MIDVFLADIFIAQPKAANKEKNSPARLRRGQAQISPVKRGRPD